MKTDILAGKRRQIRRIARNHGVKRVLVFGSQATGAASPSSDLDLLIELDPDRDLLDLADFKLDLEEMLGLELDVVTEGGLSPYLRDRILRESRPLW